MSLVQYFDDEERYADLINCYVFHGEQVVSAKDVMEVDSRKTRKKKRTKGDGRKEFVQRYQDVVRKVVFGVNIVIIGVENQSLVHYAMPVRVLSEDSMEYDKQLRKIQKQYRKWNDLNDPAEYLGEFAKTDRIPAVFSLVVYYGETPWDGARDIYELLDLTGIPDPLKSLINHYLIHVLEVRRFEDTQLFQTDLREVFEFVQCSDDKEKMREFVELRSEELSDMAEDACDLIAAVTGVEEFSFPDKKYQNKGGTVNMCKGMRDWLDEMEQKGKMEGMQEGKQEGMREAAWKLFKTGMTAQEVGTIFEIESQTVNEWYDGWSQSVYI